MTLITSTYNKTPDIPNFNDDYLKGLLWTGARWGTGTGVTVTYSFPQSGSYYEDQTAETGAFIPVNTDTQRVISEQIISQFSSVANITFTLITETPTAHADIRIAFSYAKAVTEPTVSGWAGSPGARTGGDVWLAKSVINGPYEPGAAPFHNVIHELGHAMDLKHTQESPAMPLEQESHSYSVMSYTEYRNVYMIGRGNTDVDYRAETLMLEDIRALQYIYGPNFNSKSGDTTYKWSESTGAMTTTDTALNGTQTTSTMTPYVNKIMMTVWDGGGTDTYDFSDYSTGVNVNLQPGEWTTTAANQLPSYDVGFGPAAAPPGNIANA